MGLASPSPTLDHPTLFWIWALRLGPWAVSKHNWMAQSFTRPSAGQYILEGMAWRPQPNILTLRVVCSFLQCADLGSGLALDQSRNLKPSC